MSKLGKKYGQERYAMTEQEIADSIGISHQAVHKLLDHALDKMRRRPELKQFEDGTRFVEVCRL